PWSRERWPTGSTRSECLPKDACDSPILVRAGRALYTVESCCLFRVELECWLPWRWTRTHPIREQTMARPRELKMERICFRMRILLKRGRPCIATTAGRLFRTTRMCAPIAELE